jgi:hypothetical protein
LFSAAAWSLSRVSFEGAQSEMLCHPVRARFPASSVASGRTVLAAADASATTSGTSPFAKTAMRAGHPITSSASPRRHASTICAAARPPLTVRTGSESEMANQANSSRFFPLNHAFSGDPVRIKPG